MNLPLNPWMNLSLNPKNRAHRISSLSMAPSDQHLLVSGFDESYSVTIMPPQDRLKEGLVKFLKFVYR